MKVKLSEDLKTNGTDFDYPCILQRGKEVILATSKYSEGIILESPTFETCEPIDYDGDWAAEGWILYEGTVTLSNK